MQETFSFVAQPSPYTAGPIQGSRHGPAVSCQILGNPHDFADIALWVPIGNATSTGSRRREEGGFSFFSKSVDVFGARSPEEIKIVLRPIGRSPQIGRAAENFDDLVPQKAIFKSKKYPPSMSPFGPKLAYLLSCTRIHLQIYIIPLCCCIIPIQNLRPKASDPQGVRLLPPVEGDGNVECAH